MAEIKVGDLVNWTSGEKMRAGVVKAVNDDNTCTIELTIKAGRFDERISIPRLARITSTIEAESKKE